MRQKICAIGSDRGILVPIEVLEKLKLAVGSEVEVQLDEEKGRILIEPVLEAITPPDVDADFARQLNDFIKQYRPALKKLSK